MLWGTRAGRSPEREESAGSLGVSAGKARSAASPALSGECGLRLSGGTPAKVAAQQGQRQFPPPVRVLGDGAASHGHRRGGGRTRGSYLHPEAPRLLRGGGLAEQQLRRRSLLLMEACSFQTSRSLKQLSAVSSLKRHRQAPNSSVKSLVDRTFFDVALSNSQREQRCLG